MKYPFWTYFSREHYLAFMADIHEQLEDHIVGLTGGNAFSAWLCYRSHLYRVLLALYTATYAQSDEDMYLLRVKQYGEYHLSILTRLSLRSYHLAKLREMLRRKGWHSTLRHPRGGPFKQMLLQYDDVPRPDCPYYPLRLK